VARKISVFNGRNALNISSAAFHPELLAPNLLLGDSAPRLVHTSYSLLLVNSTGDLQKEMKVRKTRILITEGYSINPNARFHPVR